jgi:hypothetical protein
MRRTPSEEVLPTIAMPCRLGVGEADGRDAGAKPCVNTDAQRDLRLLL